MSALTPKQSLHRKWQRLRRHPRKQNAPDTRGLSVSFGSFGVKATTPARITSNQLESARKAIVRAAGKGGRVWIRVFPDMPITQKPSEVRMGSGKGDLAGYVANIRPGRIIFEVEAATPEIAREALRKGGTKLPCLVKIVSRLK
jgi:large subunit ribosomal protein L16